MSRATVQTTSQLRQGRILHRLGMLAIAPMLLFAACSSSDDGGGSPPPATNNTPPPGAANQFAYVIDAVASEIRSFTMDGSGNLTQVGTAIGTGTFPHHVDVDPKGRYVYVANHGINDTPFLSGFKITSASDASLVAINGGTGSFVTSDPATEGNPHSSVMDQNGEYLYVVAGLGNSTLRAYKIDTTTGLPTLIQTPTLQSFPVGTHAHNITMSPNGQFVYVAGGPDAGLGEVFAFNRNASDGTLTPRNTITGLVEATAVAVDPQNKFLYAASVNQVSVFTIENDGSLTPIPAPNTFDTQPNGSGPHSMAIHPNGQTLYTANINANTISVFGVNSTTGALTPMQTSPRPATGTDPNFILIHPNGQVLFTADTVSDQVSRFTINADGTLTAGTPIPAATVGDGPNGIGTTKK